MFGASSGQIDTRSYSNRLLRNQCLMGVVAQLLGPNVRHQNIKLNIKAAEYGSPVEWHQSVTCHVVLSLQLCAK